MEYYKLNHEATMDDINKFKFNNQKIGVIIHVKNSKGEILLQKRGVKSCDENGLYEDIGGKFEYNDKSFKNAIMRELKEEALNSNFVTKSCKYLIKSVNDIF